RLHPCRALPAPVSSRAACLSQRQKSGVSRQESVDRSQEPGVRTQKQGGRTHPGPSSEVALVRHLTPDFWLLTSASDYPALLNTRCARRFFDQQLSSISVQTGRSFP